MERPCKAPQCPRKPFTGRRLCLSHIRELERSKRLIKAQQKKERKQNTKKYQKSERKRWIKKLDTVFSLLIRSEGRCRRCGKDNRTVKLDCSHIVGRANLAVRWDELNAKALCFRCHKIFWHGEPALAAEWLKTIRTPEELAELNRRANTVRQWTVSEMKSLHADLNAKLQSL